MKNNVKKKLIYSVNICFMILLILISVSTGQAAVSADRTIDNDALVAGNVANVTVVIHNDATTKTLSLQETIPSGWVVTRISDDAQFKASTNEWTWSSVANNAIKTVKYMITVPSGTVSGTYNINGSITANGSEIAVDGDNTIDVTGNSAEAGSAAAGSEETFGFVVTPSSATVNIGENAKYNLTISNTGSVADTYNLNTGPTNATVGLTRLSVSVGPGNSSIVGLTVNSSTKGTYVVNVTAKSKADINKSVTVTTTTSVIVPVLSITDFKSVPNTAISKTNPAHISANVIKGTFKIFLVAFFLVDSNNLLGNGANKVILDDTNTSGAQGLYNVEQWPASYMTMGNVAVSDSITVYKDSSNTGYLKVMGTFKANKNSDDTEATLFFNRTTGSLSNVTNKTSGAKLTIQNASSTFRAKIASIGKASEYASTHTFTLYSVTGNIAVNNPRILVKTVPNGKYKVYAFVNDANNTSVQSIIDVDTIPPSYTGSGGGSSSSNDGTYPTVTPTPKKTVNATPTVTTTASIKIVEPSTTKSEEAIQETTKETITETEKRPSPGFEIVAAIGIFATIYIMRRRK